MSDKKKCRMIQLSRERMLDLEATLNCLLGILSPDMTEDMFPKGQLNTARNLVYKAYVTLNKELEQNDK